MASVCVRVGGGHDVILCARCKTQLSEKRMAYFHPGKTKLLIIMMKSPLGITIDCPVKIHLPPRLLLVSIKNTGLMCLVYLKNNKLIVEKL